MQNNFERLQEQKSLFVCLLIAGLGITLATFFGKEVVKITSDFGSISSSGVFAVLLIIISLRFKKTGNHGKAWLLFLGTAISWFMAETTWSIYELVFHMNPFPSLADVFYIVGYPFLFSFSMY